MDVHKSKETVVENLTPVLSEKNNENANRSRTREITSRYRSPSPAPHPRPHRCPSPGVTISPTHSRQSAPKRAVSAERKRPPSPPKQPSPLDTRSKVNIWPSTASVSTKEKTHLSNIKILNTSRKQLETPIITRKTTTPERKMSPLKGKNAPDQSENSKPVDFLHARLVEHHMWPSRTDKFTKNTLKKSSSELSLNKCGNSDFGFYKPVSSRFFGKIATPGAIRSQSLPTTPGGSRASSPCRGMSPVHSRPSSPSRQPSNNSNINNNSVLTFTADIKKGKKGANHIEDAHELRLTYNRHLQWRFANARENAVLHSQKAKAEKMLYNVWETTSDLRGFVTEKRFELQQLKMRLKLHSVLKEQMVYLEDWGTSESEHFSSLSHAVEDLRTSILRLPVTGRARGDVETVKAAVFSAIEVMRVMGSSISFILARVEAMNSLVSELADIAARGRAMIYGCEALLASILALQVEEYSLRTHLIQMKEK